MPARVCLPTVGAIGRLSIFEKISFQGIPAGWRWRGFRL
jgi:hypothetical protein